MNRQGLTLSGRGGVCHICKIIAEYVLPGFILFDTLSATFLITGSLSSCINFMGCLYTFSKVLLRVMFSSVYGAGMADHFVGPSVGWSH